MNSKGLKFPDSGDREVNKLVELKKSLFLYQRHVIMEWVSKIIERLRG